MEADKIIMKCTIHIDGGARGNPGPAAAGVVIKNSDTDEMVHEAGYFLGHMTNNVAEYNGLLKSLEVSAELQAKELLIHSDSELMVKQINGEYRVKSPDLKPLYQRAIKLLSGFAAWKLVHVRREKNVRADELANLSMDAESDIYHTAMGGEDGGPFDAAGASQSNPTASESAPATNRFTVRLTNGDCHCGVKANRPFHFSGTTPGGCCVHATKAALMEDPLNWPNNKGEENAICQKCWQNIKVSRD